MTTNERGDMEHLLERLEHQESMLRRDPSRRYLHAADTMRDARREVVRLREELWRIVNLPAAETGEAFHVALNALHAGAEGTPR